MAEAQTTAGQIIVVNGTSGSGKSTTCELFAKQSDQFWLLHGIDHFMAGSFPAKFGHHGPRAAEGVEAVPVEGDPDGALRWQFGPQGMAAFATFHEWIASASRMGCNMIVDHLLMRDPPVLGDLAWRLDGLPALLVTLKPPYEVLERRVAERQMTKAIPTDLLGEDAVRRIVERLDKLRGWFTREVYANLVADLVIDTSVHGPEHVVAMIAARLAQGPGTAFAQIRASTPRPF